MLCIANVLNIARKTIGEKSRKDIITKVNNNERKKLIKTTFNMQKIMQRDNVSSYYQLNICEIEKAQI